MGNVQCEECHGLGNSHVEQAEKNNDFGGLSAGGSNVKKEMYMGKIGLASCVRCHDTENSPKFNSEAYWNKIKH
jgi:hypothetical protein